MAAVVLAVVAAKFMGAALFFLVGIDSGVNKPTQSRICGNMDWLRTVWCSRAAMRRPYLFFIIIYLTNLGTYVLIVRHSPPGHNMKLTHHQKLIFEYFFPDQPCP